MGTYAAPGVYVEEVPSARQPIAAVGTNTVGFIGIVPDEIKCPEPNDEYDPVLAEKAAEDASKDEKVQKLEADLKKAKEEQDSANKELAAAAPDISDANRQKLTKRKNDADAKVTQLEN